MTTSLSQLHERIGQRGVVRIKVDWTLRRGVRRNRGGECQIRRGQVIKIKHQHEGAMCNDFLAKTEGVVCTDLFAKTKGSSVSIFLQKKKGSCWKNFSLNPKSWIKKITPIVLEEFFTESEGGTFSLTPELIAKPKGSSNQILAKSERVTWWELIAKTEEVRPE